MVGAETHESKMSAVLVVMSSACLVATLANMIVDSGLIVVKRIALA